MQSVEDVLTEKGIYFLPNPNKPSEVIVRCFSGMHEDKNPSLSFNLEKGVFNCFSCGFKGNTQQFFSGLGITETPNISTKLGVRINKLKNKLETIKSTNEVRLPEPIINITHSFKGISSRTLKSFDAFFTDSNGFSEYVCIPVYQHKKLRFVEGRYKVLNSTSDMPKYLRKPNGVSVSNILFPLDKITSFNHIILVEGVFDVVKLHALSYYNSLCIFGTQNFGAEKAKLLDEYGCRRVTILMDGDAAGKSAATKIQKLLDARNIETNVITLSDGLDPGNFDAEIAESYLGKLE